MRKGLLGLSKSTRSLTRREMLAVGAAAFGGALVPGAARAQQGDQLQTLLRDARTAMKEWRWRDALALFNRAFDFGGQTWGPAEWADAGETLMRMHYHEDAVAAQHRAYAMEEAPWRAFGLILAYARLGDLTGARTCWLEIANRHREFLDDKGFQIIRQWISFCTYEFEIRVDPRGWPQDERDRFRERGWHWWLMPRNTEYQQAVGTLVGGRKVGEVTDAVGNRIWHIALDDVDRPAVLRLTTKFTPYDCQGLTCLDEVPYTVPGEYAPYTGVTTSRLFADAHVIDPTTDLARDLAGSLRGATLYETLENDLKFAMVDIVPTDDVPAEAVSTSDGVLQMRRAGCLGAAEALCALLRAQGFAARPHRGQANFRAFDEGEKPPPHGHSWAGVWIPSLHQWRPIVWGARSGSYLHGSLETMVEQLDATVLTEGLGIDVPCDPRWLAATSDFSYSWDWVLSARLTKISFDDYDFDPTSVPETAEE